VSHGNPRLLERSDRRERRPPPGECPRRPWRDVPRRAITQASPPLTRSPRQSPPTSGVVIARATTPAFNHAAASAPGLFAPSRCLNRRRPRTAARPREGDIRPSRPVSLPSTSLADGLAEESEFLLQARRATIGLRTLYFRGLDPPGRVSGVVPSHARTSGPVIIRPSAAGTQATGSGPADQARPARRLLLFPPAKKAERLLRLARRRCDAALPLDFGVASRAPSVAKPPLLSL